MFISKSSLFNKRGWWPLGSAHSKADASFTGRALLQRFAGAFNRRHAGSTALEHLATVPLGAQSSLILVRWGQQKLLIGATAQSVTLLASSSADASESTALGPEAALHEEPPQQ
jgi:flagellar biogenesis protein FliO